MPLHKLSNQHFQVRGNNLTCAINERVLVLFKQQSCGACKKVETAIFEFLEKDPSVVFAICDVGINRNVPKMSRQTRTSIQSTPTIIVFKNHLPVGIKRNAKGVSVNLLKNMLVNAERRSQHSQRQPQHPQQHFAQPYQQQPQPQQHFAPEINMPGNLSSSKNVAYANIGDEEEDDTSLLMPDGSMAPHNQPWGAYKEMH